VSNVRAIPAGQIIAKRYRVGALLGRGGMGEVYVAEHLQTGQALALKTLLPGLRNTKDVVRRFKREAKAASVLDHPNLVEVLDLGVLPSGGLYMVMELVEGPTVAALLYQGAIQAARTLAIVRQVLDGLVHAHGRGMIHRDLKPDNLMLLDVDGHELVKVLDFGLVKIVDAALAGVSDEKLTRTGSVFGTPAYMAPEQAVGGKVDARTDLYAMGIVLFEMLTGRVPFDSPDAMQLLRMHVKEPAPTLASVAPDVPWPPALEALVARALAKSPGDRFASAADMMAALDGVAAA
jgi:eukaryotic-like serine/threonine-protein kinase